MLIYLAGNSRTDVQEMDLINQKVDRLFSYLYVREDGIANNQWKVWMTFLKNKKRGKNEKSNR